MLTITISAIFVVCTGMTTKMSVGQQYAVLAIVHLTRWMLHTLVWLTTRKAAGAVITWVRLYLIISCTCTHTLFLLDYLDPEINRGFQREVVSHDSYYTRGLWMMV